LSANTHGALLELHEITKQFGRVVALDRVSLDVHPGRITALLGENGAGKTTLMRIAFGMIQPDSGSISIRGNRKRLASPSDAINAGIGMVHQQFSLVPAMTVAENVALGGAGRLSMAQIVARLKRIAQQTGLELDPSARVEDLGSADRQKLEIVRTLAHDAKVMILDEPTAVLTPKDVTDLFRQLKNFAVGGGAVVLITHKLADARAHADNVTVLRRGRVVLNAPMSETTEDSLAAAMLGRPFGAMPSAENRHQGEATSIVASFDAVVLPDSPNRLPLSLEIRAGEIVGIAALDGAARGLVRALAERMSPTLGQATLPPRIGFVPENRKDEALIPEFSLVENLALANAGSRQGILDWNSFQQDTRQLVSEFDVRTLDIDVTPEQLSGGNQQRFVLGRELGNNPPLIVLENPTQGLDINATEFVHERLRKARADGAAIVFYSSDLDELASLSDRVLVVSRSSVTSVSPDRETIGRALLGANGS
jgi:simple sugar transport system ATP-binding protein